MDAISLCLTMFNNYFLYQCTATAQRNCSLYGGEPAGFSFDVSAATTLVFLKNNVKPAQKSLKQFFLGNGGKDLQVFDFITSVSLNDSFRRWIVVFTPE